jgi:hypothetical protein
MLKDETGKKKSITQKIIIKRIRVKTKIKNKLDIYFLQKRKKNRKKTTTGDRPHIICRYVPH